MTQGKNLSVCCRRTKAFNKTFTRRKHEIKTWEKYKYKIAVFWHFAAWAVHRLQSYFLVG